MVRAQPRSAPPLHRLEKALLIVVAAHLVFLPWALGTMHVWSQSISFGFSVLSLGLALRTRTYSQKFTGGEPFRLHMGPKLLRFPIFWLGLVFLLYIVVQALNPAWEYVTDGRFWWLQRVPSINWLPTGMRTPFEQASPWRSLMIYSSAWMTVCAVWVGFTRRKSLRLVLATLSGNAFLLALLGLAERASNATRILWFWQPPAGYFVSTFIYRNHAGAYLNLLLAVTCALAFWHRRQQQRHMERSSPAVVFAVIAAVLTLIVLYSYSRGAILLAAGFLALLAAIVAIRLLLHRGGHGSRLVPSAFGLLFLAFVALGVFTLKTGVFAERFESLSTDLVDTPRNLRFVTYEATWEMARDRLLTGWGAGSFRFYFPTYQIHHPEILIGPGSHKRMLWEHAHDDYLELLAEVGVIGGTLLIAGGLLGLARLIRLRCWRNPPMAVLLGGCLVTMMHAAFDFPFSNPAILITWCALWPLMIRWLEIENARSRTSSGQSAA